MLRYPFLSHVTFIPTFHIKMLPTVQVGREYRIPPYAYEDFLSLVRVELVVTKEGFLVQILKLPISVPTNTFRLFK